MELIPTRSREKLPSGFSYPVGAEAISSALRDSSCFGDLVLDFYWKDIFWAAQYQEKLAASGRISVIVAQFSQGWSICVNAVPRAYALAARTLVKEEALPALARALRLEPEEPRYFQWVAALDLATGMLAASAVQQESKPSKLRKYRAPTRSRSR